MVRGFVARGPPYLNRSIDAVCNGSYAICHGEFPVEARVGKKSGIVTDQPEHKHFGQSKPDHTRPKENGVRYCPVSKLSQLCEQSASELDMREFPDDIDMALAEQIDVLERRLRTTLIVYKPEAQDGVLQLCQVIDSDHLGNDALRDIRALEESFGVWIVAYKTARSPGSDNKTPSAVSQPGS